MWAGDQLKFTNTFQFALSKATCDLWPNGCHFCKLDRPEVKELCPQILQPDTVISYLTEPVVHWATFRSCDQRKIRNCPQLDTADSPDPAAVWVEQRSHHESTGHCHTKSSTNPTYAYAPTSFIRSSIVIRVHILSERSQTSLHFGSDHHFDRKQSILGILPLDKKKCRMISHWPFLIPVRPNLRHVVITGT